MQKTEKSCTQDLNQAIELALNDDKDLKHFSFQM